MKKPQSDFTTALRPSAFFSRRDFLSVGASAGLAAMLPGWARAQGAGNRIDQMLLGMAAQQSFQPPMRSSSKGLLDTSLTIANTSLRYPNRPDGREGNLIYVRTYEGATTGPLLRVKPGDRLRITTNNRLPPNGPMPSTNPNYPHDFNTTNLHLHGVHVSPSGNADNVLLTVDPGQTFVNEFNLPATLPAGLYWYHPHKHGSVTVQMLTGMSGMLKVDGAIDQVPEIAAAKELFLQLQWVSTAPDGTMETYNQATTYMDESVIAVNSMLQPIIVMQPGEVQRWHILNAMIQRNGPIFLEGHYLQLYARDAYTLPRVREVSAVQLGAGSRASLLVRAGSPGIYFLKMGPTPPGTFAAYDTTPLAIVLVTGAPMSMGIPAGELPLSPELKPIAASEVTGTRRLVFSYSFNDPNSYKNFAPFINGQLFNPDVINQYLALGAVEEWTVSDISGEPHPFHIHTNPYYLIAENGVPLAEPYWADTTIVPANGSITFRIRYTDYTGPTVLHCHNLSHEDVGMMQLIQYVS